MSAPTADLPRYYRETRARVTALLGGRHGDEHLAVAATPDWSVHDVVAHLLGVAEDLANGWRPTGGPTDEWTAGHVARGRDVPLDDLLARWARCGAAVEERLAARPVWPVVIDAASHEHDLRAALGAPGARDDELVRAAASVMLDGLAPPRPLVVRTEATEHRVGPDADDADDAADAAEGVGPLRLSTTLFEAFRWRVGRRSRAQLAAMDWDGDPTPVLESLCVFGPAGHDVVE